MRVIQHLNFDWKFCPDFKEEFISPAYDDSTFELVQIPHTNKELPYNNFDEKSYQFESCYRKTLHVESYLKGQPAILHFEGVMTYARLFLNGYFVTEHKGGYTPFNVDVSRYLKYGKDNQLVVYVDSRERKEIPPFGYVVDYLTYGGIYREVWMEFTGPVMVENCHVRTRNVLNTEKLLDLDLYLENKTGLNSAITAQCSLMKNDLLVDQFQSVVLLNGELTQQVEIQQKIENVELWDTENPHLYDLVIQLYDNGLLLDKSQYRFGFREVEFRVNGFYLNGQPLKICGLNRHQSFPYVGYAMPKRAQYKDAEILKHELGLNTVRLSHYPQSQHFLDRCDELGLLVFNEIPGWQHIGDKGEWWDITRQHVKEMIRRDWNRPSIFIWGVRINESEDCDELYEMTQRIAKTLDDTRPTGGVRCRKDSHLIEDVYTYNDFVHNGQTRGLDKPESVIGHKAPYLVTEHNGHMFPTKSFDSQEHRLEHALRHLRVLDAMYADDGISGAIGWCMFDYNTHKDFGSGDRICYHGVMDMFRIPKYAAATYAAQQNETPYLQVLSNMRMGDYPGSELSDVHVFTNCEYIKLYKNDQFIETFYPARKQYPHVPNPPIIIDNLIGNLIEENETFSKKDSRLIKEILIEVGRVGIESLPLMSKLKMLYLLKKNRMQLSDGVALYSKYVGGWGDSATTFRIEGYQNNQKVCEQSCLQSFEQRLDVQVDDTALQEEATYDVTRFVVRCVDEGDNVMPYANDVLSISTKGPIEVIGPGHIALVGGGVAFWVKTTGLSGEGLVNISNERFGEVEHRLTVTGRVDLSPHLPSYISPQTVKPQLEALAE
ncbi:glycoside hydrolase family 2 protein [Endozoicomonas ascidiicola]|uniref:glycoside hydrolase family 2 protein n=1 Tax=Endozoicomonas ascidiicola TaxID=1698521 RepID=UPI000A845DE7|nr:glycoside hydrolase family 2 TIM barrel-domain containing protein [Endozoicomonas ascidiicola]